MATKTDNAKYAEDFRTTFTDCASKLNSLYVSNWEKVLKIQLAAVESLSEMSVANLKELVNTKDPKSLPEVMKKQVSQFSDFNAKLAEDMNDLMKQNVECGQEIQSVVRDAATKLMPKAA